MSMRDADSNELMWACGEIGEDLFSKELEGAACLLLKMCYHDVLLYHTHLRQCVSLSFAQLTYRQKFLSARRSPLRLGFAAKRSLQNSEWCRR